MKLCVIGDPVGHSMSPVLHRRMLTLSGIEGDYQAVTVTRETLPDFMAAGRAGEWDGCNVTMPLKQEVIRYLDQLSPEAEACGAVNTVCFRNGHTVGYNTDAPGIRAGFAARGAAPTGRALVIGNGGAARKLRQPFPFLGGQGAAFIEYGKDEVAALQRAAAALHPELLHRVVALAQTGGIGKTEGEIPQPHRFLDDIPGGAGNGGDDAALPAGQQVHQGGFSHIGAADDGGGNALPHQLPLLPALLQPGKGLIHAV